MILLDFILTLCLQVVKQKTPIPRPNVILVILDDIGARDIELIETPNIDLLAGKGRNFTRGYAMPVCHLTRRTLMFAEYSENVGPICQDQPNWQTPDSNWFSLPKPFEALGYNTAYLGKWHLGVNRDGSPWELAPQAHGFDSTFAVVPGNVSSACAGFEGDYYEWLAVENGVSYIETRYQTLVLRDKFINWWTSNRGPKFAVVSFQAAHAPFQEPPPEILPYPPQGGQGYSPNRIQFEKLVITADFVLGQMMSVVDVPNTYIIIIGDNGTPPNAIAPGMDRNKVKTTVYEGGIRIPFIILGPGITPGNSDSIVSIVDILPTLNEMFQSNKETPDGTSLVPILKNPTINVNDDVFSSNTGDRAVIQDRYKLIRLGTAEIFYDLLNDPNELQPINPNYIDQNIVIKLREKMDYYINERGL